jgi:hypothetical protein
MFNVKYDFSCIHVNVPSTLAADIMAWGKTQVVDDDIFVTQKDPTFGREDEIHTTILYGIHSESPDQSTKLLSNCGPITATLGKVSVFTNPPKYDVVMIEVKSPDLCRLNELVSKNIPHTNRYGAYKPHITVAYVKKGRGWKHFGINQWSGIEFQCTDAVFSSKNGTKYQFFL